MSDRDRTRSRKLESIAGRNPVFTPERVAGVPAVKGPRLPRAGLPPRLAAREVAGYLADRFVDRLGLAGCTIYLYDEWRLSLTEAAHRGPANVPRPDASLEPGSSLAGFELEFGAPGGCFTLPLWDGHRLLGVVHGRLPPDRELREDTLGPAHWLVTGSGLAISLALSAEGVPPALGGGAAPARPVPHSAHVLNRYLAGHLRGAFREATGGQVVLAMLRLGGRVRRGILPVRGVSLPKGALGSGGTCRGFGFGSGSSRIALVWQGATRERVGETLAALIQSRLPMSQLTGPTRAGRLASTAVVAAAVSVYPDDATDDVGLLASVVDLLEAHSYLLANPFEGRDGLISPATNQSMLFMDRNVLDSQISELRQELKEAIAGGLSFGDAPVREISERLDRVIVVMQRLMGHRGADT